MQLPKSFTKITPLSKTLALILLITLPILGFYFGMYYKQTDSYPKEDISNKSQKNITDNKVAPENEYLTNDKAVFNFITNTKSYVKSSSSINFECFNEYSLPDKPQINQLKEELTKKNRAINTVCTNNSNKKVILVSADKIAGRDSNHNLFIELLDFYEPTQYTSEYLFQEEKQLELP